MTTEAACELNDFHSNSPSNFGGYFNRFSVEEVQYCMPCSTSETADSCGFVSRMSPSSLHHAKQKKTRKDRRTSTRVMRDNYCSLFRMQTPEEDSAGSLSASSTESLNSLTNFPLRPNKNNDEKLRRALIEQSPNPESICDLLAASATVSSPNQIERQKSDPVDIMGSARSKNGILKDVEKVIFDIPEITLAETQETDALNFNVSSPLRKVLTQNSPRETSRSYENRKISAPCRMGNNPKGVLLNTQRSKSPFRKAVTFADNQGRSLLHVLSFEKFQDLDFSIDSSTEDLRVSPPVRGLKTFAPLFFLPPFDSELPSKLQQQKVKLESVNVIGLVVMGTVVVLNLSYAKEVTLRYTTDGWDTFRDVQLSHVPGSDSFDRFSFEINFHSMNIRDKVVFCIRFVCDSGEFWDSNNGFNYTLKLLDS